MILQIVGMKNSGKTTLMNHAISFLKERGYSVVTIKHHGHIGEEIELQSSDVDHMNISLRAQTKVLFRASFTANSDT